MKEKKWKVAWATNKQMMVLAYTQKIIALVVAIYFAFAFIYPVMLKAINLNPILIAGFIILTLFVFELILHFSLENWIRGLFKREFQIINIAGSVLTFVVIALLGWYSTENIDYFRNDVSTKVSLINIDSLKSIYKSKEDGLINAYQSRERLLDSLNLPILAKTQAYPYVFLEAQKSYQSQRKSLLEQKDKELSLLGNKQISELTEAKKSNEVKASKIQKEDRADAKSTSLLGLGVLLFSLYSTVVIAVHSINLHGKKNTKEEIQTVAVLKSTKEEDTKVQSKEREVQNLQLQVDVLPPVLEVASTPIPPPFVVNVQNVVINQTQEQALDGKSDKRVKATEYYIKYLKDDESIKDKEKFAEIKKGFGISWGTYSDIKRELKKHGNRETAKIHA
jgi:hypothetical protein